MILYKVLHLIGLILLFLGVTLALMPKDTPHRRLSLAFHGVGLLLLLVGGFGLLAKLQLGFPWWVGVKLALWIAFGAMPIIGKRGLLPVPAAWAVAILCGVLAIILGVTHGNFGAMFGG